MDTKDSLAGVSLSAPALPRQEEIVSPGALAFVAGLAREFEPVRQRLLVARADRQRAIDAGEIPDFLAATARVRADEWSGPAAPLDLHNRRVEITGPIDRKMMINALNSGANVFMADFEDANSPTWENLVEGQVNLIDAIERTISLETPGKSTGSSNGRRCSWCARAAGI